MIDLSKVKNPIFECEPDYSPRDPAVIYNEGVFRCFHSAYENKNNKGSFFLNVCESTDLATWDNFKRLTTSDLNFSSPGNILRVGDKWIMCVQSYPIKEGSIYGGENSRLWIMESHDLITWRSPKVIKEEGCEVNWTQSSRQIDPFMVYHENKVWCFYKTSGEIGLLVSEDLETWEEVSPDKPVFSAKDTPDGSSIENPCIILHNDEYIMFFSPCRKGRGIGTAKSKNLIDWTDVRYLDFPELSWAEGGCTAAMVLDMRKECGKWLMFFHGDRAESFSAAMGLAFSDDLENWIVN